jgi:phenylacetic acid degradation operon negative regulatory protein
MFLRSSDSRLLLLMMAAETVEATGRAVAGWWERSSRRGRLSQTLRDLEAQALIGRSGSGPLDARIFRITDSGRRAVLGELDPEALWSRRWDGTWRMVLFDVPQSRAKLRTSLRRKLRDLRFGWLQNSVWLSPDPVEEFVRGLEQQRASVESLLFFEGRPAGHENDASLVAGAWDFGRLAKLHATYLRLLKTRPSGGFADAAKPTEWSSWLEAEARAWREIARHDPFLPEALWPEGYAGREVWKARVEALTQAGRALAQVASE